MTSRHPFFSRSCLAAGIALAVVGAAGEARADDPTKEQCASANEEAVALREKGKLKAARAQLLVCVAKSCPGPVRDDCAERLTEIEKATPTIVFSAKGAADTDLAAVKVTMDGAPITERLDGSAVAVEPGEHTFELTTSGYPTVTKKLVIREGEKGRQEVVVFASSSGPPAETARAPVGVGGTPEEGTPPASGSGQRTVAYVLGGAGLLGIGLGTYFGLRAKSTYDDATALCPSGPASCDPSGTEGGKDAHTQATVATVMFITGVALLGTGIVVYLTAPKDAATTPRPTARIGAGSIHLGATW